MKSLKIFKIDAITIRHRAYANYPISNGVKWHDLGNQYISSLRKMTVASNCWCECDMSCMARNAVVGKKNIYKMMEEAGKNSHQSYLLGNAFDSLRSHLDNFFYSRIHLSRKKHCPKGRSIFKI